MQDWHRKRFVVPALSGLLASCVLWASSHAQAPSSCAGDCHIELLPLVTLTDAGHPGVLPDRGIFVTRDRLGRFLLASRDSTRIVVFDKAGRISRLVDGRSDQQVGMITNLLSAPDGSLRVYDTMRRTLAVMDDEFRMVSATPFRYRPTVMIQGNRYILAEQIATPDRVGQPLHLLASDGAIIRSFGSDEGTYRADQPARYNRVVAASSAGTIWSAPQGRYVLEEWDPATGARRSQIAVKSTWFKESARFPHFGERPVPAIAAMWEVDDCLWVLFQDADSNWRPPPGPSSEREPSVKPEEYDTTYDSVLEVVAIESGRLVATKRFDRRLWGREPSFMVAARRQSPAGRVTQVEVWKPQLVRREKK